MPGKCKCGDGFWDDATDETCKPCHESCATCISAGVGACVTCKYDPDAIIKTKTSGTLNGVTV